MFTPVLVKPILAILRGFNYRLLEVLIIYYVVGESTPVEKGEGPHAGC